MSIDGYKIRDQYAVHFITFSVIEWIDVFTRKDYADIIIESLNYCKAHKGLKVHAWCIMSNHLHLMLSATLPQSTLSDIIRDFKKFTSYKIVKAIEENPRESRKNGCYGYSAAQENAIFEMKNINFGNKIITQFNAILNRLQK